MRFGIGAIAMASGRRPSIETITTRRAGGAKVGVGVGVGVSVGVGVWVGVAVDVSVGVMDGVNVSVGVGVGPKIGALLGIWQASRMNRERAKRKVLRRDVFTVEGIR
jgi:hypothetical protein